MKKLFTCLLVLTSLFSFSQSTTLVISQFYGAGGNTGAVLNADYVELHNISASAVNISGYTIQYTSATNMGAWTGVSPLPAASIPAGGYYLIQMNAAGAVGAAIPTPDYVSNPTIAMSGTSGKVALVNGLTPLNGCPATGVVDLVGYGTANCFETAATAVLMPTTGGIRNDNGCAETNNNSADFTIATPAPRNSASPVFICSTSTSPTITAGAIVDFGSVTVGTNSPSQSFNISGSNLTGAPGNITITSPSVDFQVSADNTAWGSTATIPYTAATLSSTLVYVRFTPQTAGPKSGNVTITGGGVTTAVNVAVSGNGVVPGGPLLNVTTSTDFGNVCINTTAGPNSFTITGTDLTTANVTVGPLTGYAFSTTSGGTYTNSLTIPQPGGSFSQVIFVQFTPVAIASYSGNIPVGGGGVSAPVNVPVSGAGVNAAPTVTTGSASAITFTSATLAGNIASPGCTAVTGYGIEYSLTSGFVPGTGTVVSSSNLAGSDFSSNLSLLTPGTTYYYITYATNAGGTGYGVQQSFTTGSSPLPTLTAGTLAPFGNVCVNTSAGPNSLDISGTNLTTADVVIGPLAGYTFSLTAGGTYSASLTIPQPGGSFTQSIFVNFTPTTITSYNGNIPISGGGAATSINVTASGAGVNSAPALTTGSASAILATSATIAGDISTPGCSPVTAYGIEYSLINGFTPGTGTVASSGNLSGTGFSSDLSGLTPGTTYYYVAFATNAGGTAYGVQQSFTTAAAPPGGFTATSLPGFGGVCVNTASPAESFNLTGTNLSAADITIGPLPGYTFSTSATGTFTNSLTITQPGGAFTQTIFVIFTPTSASTFDGNIPVSGAGSAGITVATTGTGSNTIVGINTGGVDSTGASPYAVIAMGSVSSVGCSEITSYGIEFSSFNGFANGSGIKVQSLNLSGNDFSSQLSGLVQSTTYFYKAYAINSAGISYGSQESFTTPSIPGGLIVYSTPILRGADMHYSLKGVKPGHYAARIFNHVGQLVYQKDMILQVNFIDDHLIFPATLPVGLYSLQIYNYEYKVQKIFMVQ